MFIGVDLGIDAGTLNAIDANNGTIGDCLLDMIIHWLCNYDPVPTRDAITIALQSERVSSVTGICPYTRYFDVF